MTYARPEIAVLGNASELIEQQQGKATPNTDGPSVSGPNAAYDLDE